VRNDKNNASKQDQRKETKRNQLLNHTKLAIGVTTALIGGYAGRVHAGSCTSPSPSVCSGAANSLTDTTQSPAPSGGNLTVTTNAGFGIDTTTKGGIAINLVNTGKGDIIFTDVNNSVITSNTGAALYVNGVVASATITTSGVITSNGGAGISAVLTGGSGPLTIDSSGNISSSSADAISANTAFASVTITGSGNITALGGDGINITTSTGSISVSGTGNVTSKGGDGIFADIPGKGATVTGNITIARDGIINAVGPGDGIHVSNTGKGDNIITVTRAIIPDTGIGIVSNNLQLGVGADTFITLNAGADVQGGISNNTGDSTTVVNSGAALSGSITLADGNDSLTFAGGSFSGVTAFDGGDDTSTADGFTDELVFSGSSGTINAAIVTNWERILIDSGSSIDFSDGATKTLNTGVLDNLGGTLNMINAAPIDQLTVSGDYGGGGTLAIEAELNAGGSSDTLIINGDTSGNTTVTISNIGVAGALTVGNGMLIVQVNGNSNGTFTLAAPVRSGDYLYELVKVGNNWYLQSHLSPAAIPTLSQWGQIMLASLLGLFGLFGTNRRKKANRAKL